MSDRFRGDRGAATMWMVMGTVIVLAVCGLVFDGGLMISAKRDATNDAEAAARAGVQGRDLGAVYSTGPKRIDPTTACELAPPVNGLLPTRGGIRHCRHTTLAHSLAPGVPVLPRQRFEIAASVWICHAFSCGAATSVHAC